MKFIKIKSKGEIDEKAFYLLGASSKREDSTKIGMFGSGLKYSLAFLLRNNIPFKVFSGYREVKFSINKQKFRDKEFDIIYVNDKETSLTTDMGGIDWKSWSVIREIYSNAMDEGDALIEIIEENSVFDCQPIEDFTTFYIQINDDFQEIIDNWNLYFSEKRTDLVYHDKDFNQLYNGGDTNLIYRKGIRCHFTEKTKSIFHYDLSWVKINESRILSDEWTFRYNLVKFLKCINNKSVVHRILYNINDYWEKTLDWSYHGSVPFSDFWLTEIGDKYVIPYENAGFWDEEIKLLKSKCIILPSILIQALKNCFGDKIKCIGEGDSDSSKSDKKLINELTNRERYLLEEALGFLKEVKYEVKFPVKICKFVNQEILGQAEKETIFISDKVFNMGKREIINTIIEENHHLITGHQDETRAMQTSLINLVITQMEERLGKYL